jgi:hypothetical protein
MTSKVEQDKHLKNLRTVSQETFGHLLISGCHEGANHEVDLGGTQQHLECRSFEWQGPDLVFPRFDSYLA